MENKTICDNYSGSVKGVKKEEYICEWLSLEDCVYTCVYVLLNSDKWKINISRHEQTDSNNHAYLSCLN